MKRQAPLWFIRVGNKIFCPFPLLWTLNKTRVNSLPLAKNEREETNTMKKQDFLLPMDLQFFADPNPGDGTDVNPEGNEPAGTEDDPEPAAEGDNEPTEPVDSDKVIEKLQKRIGKEQAEKNDAKNQLTEALKRIEELEKGTKKPSIKEKSEAEKAAEAQKVKDDEISKLKAQIKRAEVSSQADEVLKEAGLSVGKDMLGLVVSEDEETTYANVKTLIAFLNDQQKTWEVKRNTGSTPKRTPENTEVDPFKEAAKKYMR